MSLKDSIKEDLATIQEDFGYPIITYNGEDYAAIVSTLSTVGAMEWGGFSEDCDLVVTINKDLFVDGVMPIPKKQNIFYKDIEYRIQQIKEDASGAILRMYCTDTSRGV